MCVFVVGICRFMRRDRCQCKPRTILCNVHAGNLAHLRKRSRGGSHGNGLFSGTRTEAVFQAFPDGGLKTIPPSSSGFPLAARRRLAPLLFLFRCESFMAGGSRRRGNVLLCLKCGDGEGGRWFGVKDNLLFETMRWCCFSLSSAQLCTK